MTAGQTHDELADRATALWLAAAPAGSRPDRVEKLKRGWRTSAVLRLVGAGPDGQPIVAKLAGRRSVALEAHVYRHVLSELGVSAPRCLGLAADGDMSWLFLEDAGDGRFDSRLPSHRRLAATWMARVHGGARLLPRARELPERGPRHYRALLGAVERLLDRTLANPALSGEEVGIVEGLLGRVRALASMWPRVESSLDRAPATIAFGGFSGKNARVQASADGPVLMPFDFESAGHGRPVIDLVHVDGDVYVSEARGWWDGLDIREFKRMQALGRVLGGLKAIPGERRPLLGPSPSEAVAELRWYDPLLQADPEGVAG
jgi:Phosphotransferase enzyme family